MHLTKAKIAALVLGYLRSEKLLSVVDEFLQCCPHLTDNVENIKMGKYFSTRVSGMTLVDCLEQFALIYATVQSRLEETNYYELHRNTTIPQQLIYLLDNEPPISSSTPFNFSSELDATPAHSLPGNVDCTESDSIPKTPKRRTRSKSKENVGETEDVIDMTEVLTLSLLENHELHEKIAETINFVMNTPEVAKSSIIDECISDGASKELDAVIKTVIQKTEEDPIYNKLIDEIIGTTNPENPPPHKKSTSLCTPTSTLNVDHTRILKAKSTDGATNCRQSVGIHKTDLMIDDLNNDAIRSIIEASQNTDSPLAPPQPSTPSTSQKDPTTGEVYVFDGSLDTYLKTSGATNSNSTNPVYFNSGGLIVMPPQENQKQFYIVNNQPLLKMNVPVLTEKELMSLPTVIVNDENSQPTPSTRTKRKIKRTRVIKPKSDNIQNVATAQTQHAEVVTVIAQTHAQIAETVSRPVVSASHVRNLDFSTPTTKTEPCKKSLSVWDADLRQLINGFKDKSPTPKKKKPSDSKNKKKKKSEGEDEEEKKEPEDEEKKEPEDEDKKEPENEEKKEPNLMTPVKDTIPKTPGGMLDTSGFHCTPFNDVINEQLKGVDLNSIETPSIPITPGFSLTPGDLLSSNQRLTDYSGSSSYYQPSDSEQKVTMCQLIEECERLEKDNPRPKLKIISDEIIKPAEVQTNEPIKKSERLKKFNRSIIGKKNLSLIKPVVSSSSESETDEEKESDDTVVVAKNDKESIQDIIQNVEIKNSLEDEKKKSILLQLEVVRQRTVNVIKKTENKKSRSKKAPPKPKITKKKTSKKKTEVTETRKEDDAQNLWLAQRGIHLIPNKTPQKRGVFCIPHDPKDDNLNLFDNKNYEDFEIMVHNDKSRKKKKSYDLAVSSKGMSVQVLIDNEEVTRIIRWTQCELVLDGEKLEKMTSPIDDELMDFCVAGRFEKSPDKGGKKRKAKFSDETKQKRNKVIDEHNLKLLKKVDVDAFLDKVHGE